MKIIELRAENIKRLSAVQITPDGHLVQVTGRNGQGKTSVLDSIWWALAGTRSHQHKPIRDGATEARIELDLGEIVVKRQFRQDAAGATTTQLVVESAEGARFASPQRMLDSLLGGLSFDPLAFSRAAPREQWETLSGFAGVDLEAFERENQRDYDERRQANREAKEQRAAGAAIDVPADAPDSPIVVRQIAEELREAQAENDRQEAEARNQQRRLEAINQDRDRLKRSLEQLDELKRTVVRQKADCAAFSKEIDETLLEIESEPAIPDRVDTSAITARLEDADRLNEAYRLRARSEELAATAKLAEAKSAKLTSSMTSRAQAVQDAIAAADMPVNGLTLEGGAVQLDGVPLEQASDAEQLQLSCAIAMRQNAKLRVLRIRDGSLLDEDNLELLRWMADKHDFQIWIERVDTTGAVGFVIEDGMNADVPEDGA